MVPQGPPQGWKPEAQHTSHSRDSDLSGRKPGSGPFKRKHRNALVSLFFFFFFYLGARLPAPFPRPLGRCHGNYIDHKASGDGGRL